MMPQVTRYPDGAACAQALATRVAELLRQGLAARGRAALAVPGGTTPGPFLTLLGQADLDWARVAVTLTDERQVPLDDPRSNQRLLAQTLFAGPAAAAEFVPLLGADLGAICASLHNILLPLDVAVLGMGEDMHTASLFPGALGLAAALAPDAPAAVAIQAPGAPEPRVTLSAAVLRAAPHRFLLITGAAKAAALARAATLPIHQAPVRAVLDGPPPADVYFWDNPRDAAPQSG